MKKFFEITFCIVGALVFLWAGASWFDVMLNSPTCAEWNLFTLLVEVCTTLRG